MHSEKPPTVTRAAPADVTPDAGAVQTSLSRILASPEFDGADRIQSLLSYIVEEELAGRGTHIHSKTILHDVYGRSPEAGRDSMAVVRVDAGRLRRRLSAYYAATGASDAIRFHVDPGGYRPRFEQHAPDQPDEKPARRLHPVPVIAGLTLLIVIAGVVWTQTRPPEPAPTRDPASRQQQAIREALFDASPARLQAANLAGMARGLLFPALEPAWLELVLDMFELTIRLDPDYYGGYAGAAQAEALIAVALPRGEARDLRLQEADGHVAKAKERGIDHSWTHSAASLVALAKRDYDTARSASDRAIALDPEDADAINVDALVALFSGDFERAIRQADRTGNGRLSPTRFPTLSIMAAANIHLGQFDTALTLLDRAKAQGDPISPISLGYLIAAQSGLGHSARAEELVALLTATWPGFPMDGLLLSLYRDSDDAEQILAPLRAAGWTAG